MSDFALIVKEGTTWGTAVTPDRTVCGVLSGERLNRKPKISESAARCWGQRGPSASGMIEVSKGTGGSIPIELSTLGFGFWWKMCLGTVTSTLVDGAVYQQVHTMASGSLPFFTAQKLLQSHTAAGVMSAQAQTYDSLMVSSWSLEIPESGVAKLTVTTVGRDVVTTTPAVTPAARPAGDHRLHSGGASLSTGTLVAGDADALTTAPTPVAGVRSLSIEVDNNLIELPRWGGGAQPLLGMAPSVKGTLDVENITGSPFIAASISRTPMSLLAKLAAVENSDELAQVIIPGLIIDPESLPVGGSPSEVQRMSVPFTGVLVAGGDPRLIYVETRTYDTTV